MTGDANHCTTASWPRALVVMVILCVAGLPLCPVLVTSFTAPGDAPLWTHAFTLALANSLLMAAAVSVIALAIGLPLGILASLYQFRGRDFLVLAQALPLLLPSFLPSIGWTNLSSLNGLRWLGLLSGEWTCILVMSWQAVPLVLFAVCSACEKLTASQVESARLYGGERTVLLHAARACAPVAIAVALLAGILSLSDVGAPLIFGVRSAAVEIRTSFSALYDFNLAGRQCWTLTAIVLLLAAPLLAGSGYRIAAAILARQLDPHRPIRHRYLSHLAAAGLAITVFVSMGIPLAGICFPVISHPMWARAAVTVGRTLGPTALFSVGSGAIAVTLAMVLAVHVRGQPVWRLAVIVVLMLFLAAPPALAAIGVLRVSSHAPQLLDGLLRGRATVPVIMGLRLLPVAVLLILRADASFAPSWRDVARVHGVSPVAFYGRVVAPFMAPPIMAAWLLVAVLSMADVTTTHLLQPPGTQTLPVAIFTVMANSPTSLVAALCLACVLLVATTFVIAMLVMRAAPWRSRCPR